VRITLGGNNAGFISLHAALAYLEAHPDQTVWVMNWDAPGRPKSMQINENLVLLVLAGPDYKAERASLAWMSYPATRKVADFETGKDQPPRAMQAWQAVFVEAARHGRKTEEDIGYVIHDANKTLPTSSERLARLAQALNWKCPASTSCRRPSIRRPCWAKWAPARRMSPWASPMRITWANPCWWRAPAIRTTSPACWSCRLQSTPHRPRQAVVPHAGENNAYLPWWGIRHDTADDMQGYSQ
jgi:hypothetical protein